MLPGFLWHLVHDVLHASGSFSSEHWIGEDGFPIRLCVHMYVHIECIYIYI